MQQDWETLERVFSEALELPPEDRLRFVKEQSGDNLWLLQELETLLAVPEGRSDAAFDSGTGIVKELLAALDSEYAVGREIGGYRIESLIFSGGMGIVYKAVNLATGESVALKVLPPEDNQNPRRVRRLAREAAVLQLLDHPGIVKIKEYCSEPGCQFLVMELIAGETLQTLLANQSIPLDLVLDWSSQIAAAVQAAHERGVVHRDLKPSNIMIERASGRVKLLDFGLARIADAAPSAHTQTTVEGTVAGTFSYFSPEQAAGGRGDERSDIFSFGAVLYEMVAGRRAFERPGAAATAAAVLTERPDPLPEHVPTAVRVLIERCLEKEPSKRFATMQQAGVAIENLRTLSREGRLKPPMKRRARLALALGTALAATVAAGWFLEVRQPAAPPRQSVAVLPFTSRTSDAASRYLSAGLTGEVTETLSRLKSLRVTAQSSARQVGSQLADPRAAGRQLHVENVLEGSVEHEGDHFKLSARLLRVSDGLQLWSNSFEHKENDLGTVQAELAAGIEASLKVLSESAPAQHVPLPEAHEFVMKARYEAEQMTTQAVNQAEADLRRAVELDPQYAAAYLGLGFAMFNRVVARGSLSQTPEERKNAEQFIHKALELEPNLASAHSMLARLAMQYDWDWVGAERELRKVPLGTSAEVEESFAYLRLFQKRFAEANEHIRRSQDLDPFSTATMNNLTTILNLEGRVAEARDLAHRLSASHPQMLMAKLLVSVIDIEEGRTDEALRDTRELEASFPGAQVIEAMAFAKAGKREDALRLIRPFEDQYSNSAYPTQWFGVVYGLLGDEPNALKWLERSADRHEWQALNLSVNPTFAFLRGSPGFRALEKRMGLPQ